MTSTPRSDRRQHGDAATWALVGFALIALFFLLTEHRAHFFGWLPFLLLAACPLMHMFHRGHGAHGDHGGGADRAPPRADEPRSPAEPAATQPTTPHHH